MSSKYPVVVYGASGYTGRLIAEYLRDYQIPFIAAGRNAERVEEAMRSVPGIDTAKYSVAEVAHDSESLADLFDGAKVVCNVVGPFTKFGETVVEATLKAGVHYIDTTGEQSHILNVADKFAAQFAEKGLLLAPATSYMYETCNIAVSACLEKPGIDMVNASVVAAGVPTYASTQSVFDMIRHEQKYLECNELVNWPVAKAYEVSSPGSVESIMAMPWSGTSLPAFYADDPRVHTLKVLCGFCNRQIMEGVLATWQHFEKEIKQLPEAEQIAAISAIADQVQSGMPPRENPRIHRTVDSAWGTGTSSAINATVFGVCGYKQTGVIQAHVASHLISGASLRKVGLASACQAMGYEEILGALRNYGLANLTVREY